MLIDRVRIRVTGGSGGNGCCSFRREKYVPLGGPDGGDGGNGGAVDFVATSHMSSLLDLRYRAHVKGKRGTHGKGKGCHGRTGEPIELSVPQGTLVRDLDSGKVLCDLVEEGQRYCAGQGGTGGKGNPRFVTPANRAPKFAERGEPGEEHEYLLELKLIAEVGIVGLPNAGKSTLLSRVSAAQPKIADYPFTTLTPNLGVVELDDYRTLTLADIPGIIEGAARGKGLGHDFLRHIERTRVLLFLVDLCNEDPAETLRTLEKELADHSSVFAGRRRIVALNKADLTENRKRFSEIARGLRECHMISAATGEGVPALLEDLWMLVERVRNDEAAQEPVTPDREYTYQAPYEIMPAANGFRIEGTRVLRAVRMTDFENEEAVRHLQVQLQRMGIFKGLKRLGAQAGQTISIGELEMEYKPD